MAFGTVLVCLGNAVAAAILVNAAAAKLVAPERLATALRQLAPASIAGWIGLDGEGTGAGIARTAAGVEAAAAVGLLVPEVRVPAAALLALLGACFAALGLAGSVRGGTAPCGCFGVDSDRPLGAANVVGGLAMVGLAALNARHGLGAGSRYAEAAPALASILSIALSLWMRRRLVTRLLLARRAATPGSEVR
jgi:hypothetical protein